MKKIYILLFFILISIPLFLTISGCGKAWPKDQPIYGSYTLLNQDNSKVTFPDDFRHKVIVMAFIYTHCPDVCPLTVNNMKLVQEKLKADGDKGVQFIAVSFDPNRDTPHVLKEYAGLRNIDLSNFQFLTGNKAVIDSLMKVMHIVAIFGDTTTAPGGGKTYYITHTDRISLIDQNTRLRKDYKGSGPNVKTIIADVKSLI